MRQEAASNYHGQKLKPTTKHIHQLLGRNHASRKNKDIFNKNK